MEKKEGKLLIMILAIIVVIVSFTGCFSVPTPAPASSSSSASSAGSPVNVTFRNLTGVTIEGLFIDVNVDRLMESTNWLGDNVIRPNNTFSVRLAPGRYIILAISSDASFYSFNFNVTSSGGTWSIEPSDKLDI